MDIRIIFIEGKYENVKKYNFKFIGIYWNNGIIIMVIDL